MTEQRNKTVLINGPSLYTEDYTTIYCITKVPYIIITVKISTFSSLMHIEGVN